MDNALFYLRQFALQQAVRLTMEEIEKGYPRPPIIHILSIATEFEEWLNRPESPKST